MEKNFEKFSLYDEEKRVVTTTTTGRLSPNQDEYNLIEIDLSEPETLFTMSKKVRDVLQDKPDDYQLTLYLVCGNNCSCDAGLFADYLKDVSQPIVIAFRGIIHFDFIHLFIKNIVYINKLSQIKYSKAKLHDTMKNFLVKPETYKRFMQRFVDDYWKLNDGNLLPLTELELLGIKVEFLT